MIVYILQSLKDGGYYVGCTSDIKKRIKCHNAGMTKSLKSRRPLVLVYSEQYKTSADAYAREKQIKSYKGGVAFQKLLNKV